MQTPLQISVRNVEDSDAARALVQKCVEKLEVFYARIISCRVMIDVPQRFPAGSPVAYNVRVDIRVPGEEIVIRRQGHSDLHTAIQDAFDAAGRRLQYRRHGAYRMPARYRFARTPAESKTLNDLTGPFIIISASGGDRRTEPASPGAAAPR